MEILKINQWAPTAKAYIHSKSMKHKGSFTAPPPPQHPPPPPGWDATCKPMGPHSKSLYLFQEHEALGSFTLHHPPPPPGWDGMLLCSPSPSLLPAICGQ